MEATIDALIACPTCSHPAETVQVLGRQNNLITCKRCGKVAALQTWIRIRAIASKRREPAA